MSAGDSIRHTPDLTDEEESRLSDKSTSSNSEERGHGKRVRVESAESPEPSRPNKRVRRRSDATLDDHRAVRENRAMGAGRLQVFVEIPVRRWL